MRLQILQLIPACALGLLPLPAADQTKPGPGNLNAVKLADASPLVQSARQFLSQQAGRIHDPKLRVATLDAIGNPNTCVAHRAGLTDTQKTAILRQLRDQGLVDASDDARAGVFPPLIDDGRDCPKLPQPFYSAPGSSFGGHHSYPGGLMLHEALNEISSLNLADAYRRVYGSSRSDGLPVVAKVSDHIAEDDSDILVSEDILIAAPLWHDWAKSFVFQWNADGTEFQELSFGGSGASQTGAHHILGIAEAIKRGLPPDFVITLASAHSAPSNNLESKVVDWIRAASIIAQVDPVAAGYLRRENGLHLAHVRQLGPYSNLLVEYVLHNLSDSDFTFTGPAVSDVQSILAALAPQFGFDASETAAYNNQFRNVVLSYFSAERLLLIYGNSGLDGVTAEITKIRPKLSYSNR